MIYIVRLSKGSDSWLKLGYTGKDHVTDRTNDYKKHFEGVEVMKVYDKQDVNTLKLERALHKLHKEDKLSTGLDFGGKTECYSWGMFPIFNNTIVKTLDDYDFNVPEHCLKPWLKYCKVLNNLPDYKFEPVHLQFDKYRSSFESWLELQQGFAYYQHMNKSL